MNNSSKRINIGLDFDDVLMDFNTALCVFHNSKYGSNFTRNDIFSWHFKDVWGGTEAEAIKKVQDFYSSYEHDNAGPVFGAVEAVDGLCKLHNVSVVTSRTESVNEQTVLWLEKYFPALSSSIHFTNHFYGENKRNKKDVCLELEIEVFVEDSLLHIKDIAPHVKRAYLLDTPWNRQADVLPSNVKRVFSWREITDDIDSLSNSNTDPARLDFRGVSDRQ